MKLPFWAALAVGAALFGADALPPVPSPPLCRVTAHISPGVFPGVVRITVRPRPECLRGGAFVRLASPIGGTDPPDGRFKHLRAGEVWVRPGVLSYWHVEWRAASGKTYIVPLGGAP